MIDISNLPDMPIEFYYFDDAKKQVEIEVRQALLTAPKLIRDYIGHLTLSRGKSIRAVSCLVCAENADLAIHQNAVKVAAAIELLHLATLVHDDVIDNAETRRGIITLQKKFGKRTAVICGDYLLSLSFKTAASVTRDTNYINLHFPDYSDYSDYIGKICMGELRQNINNKNYDLSFYEYIKIISGKTAALFEASFRAGAQLCDDVTDDEIGLYSRLGHYIGLIFQLTDDCIDYESTPELAKKPILSDYRQGVISLPLIYTFEKDKEIKRRAKANTASIDEISCAVAQTGGVDFTRHVSKKYYEKAMAIINIIRAGNSKRERLTAVLNSAYYTAVLPDR
ncbi:MAG: polyprenyl synthetase family protein [Eubacteriales bacterium]|jgi:heptaprenyl diphosphate synthase|nr:polyprenyl synthetase family protein [Eubacteriales bacterium]